MRREFFGRGHLLGEILRKSSEIGSGKSIVQLQCIRAGVVVIYLRGNVAAFGKLSASPSVATEAGPINRQLVIGAAIFGIGWGRSGFCPGPSLANLGALCVEALVFVPAMAIGMLVAQRFFGADARSV